MSASQTTTPESAGEPDFAAFDQLVAAIARWSGSLPAWPPAARVQEEWRGVEPRLERARRELSRVLVVGVVGGTGTGKSTLVNALAGRNVTEAGDVARPTTTSPVVVAAPDVDLSWLPLDTVGARVVRSDAAAVANIVIVDCPDPDTQSGRGGPDRRAAGDAARPSDANRNRDLLEAVLPACDVLVLVATAQKYRSWIVAREVAAFAPGRPLFFVQSHASRDPDIRADWRQELESQGFDVPRIFRLDGVEAGRRAAVGLEPEPGFRELLRAIDEELVGRAARRVRRTGALDMAAWFTGQCRERLAPLGEPVAALATGVEVERARLEGILSRAVAAELTTHRHGWQRLVTEEIVDRWRGGPFATFLHVMSAVTALWNRVRPAGGIVGRLVAGEPAPVASMPAGWQPVAELGLPEAEVEQSRTILAGLAARAGIDEPLVGRPRLEAARVAALAGGVLERTGQWLGRAISRVVADRRSRLGGPALHIAGEVLFGSLVVVVLARAAWSFFHGHLWLGQPVAGGSLLQESLVWVLLWGLLLRWALFAVVRIGLDRDIASIVSGLSEARPVEPLLGDYAAAACAAREFLDGATQLSAAADRMATALAEPTGDLGRLRTHEGSR